MAIDFPASPSTNDIHQVGSQIWFWNATYWELKSNVTKFSSQDAAPSSPIAGDIWYETDTGKLFIRYDSYWVEIGHGSDGQSFIVSETKPASTTTGNIWYESDTGKTFIYYDSYWVEIGHASDADVTTTVLTGSTNTWIPIITAANALTGTANFTYDGNTLDVKNSGTASSIKLYCETSNAHYQAIKAAPHSGSSNWTLTLPPTVPSVSGQVLTATTSGVASWATVGGDSDKIEDADADTKIQVEEASDEDKIRFDTGGTERAVLDSSGLEIKTGNLKVPSGNGIDFSATGDTAVTGAAMSSELLDDYEEGTWTASFLTGGGTIAPNTAYDQMNYTKIGRLVNVSGNVDGFTVSSPTGALQMTGLPYAVADTAERSDRAAFTVLARGLVSAESDIFGYFTAGSGLVINYGNGGTSGGGAHMATIIDAGSYIHINATYTAAT